MSNRSYRPLLFALLTGCGGTSATDLQKADKELETQVQTLEAQLRALQQQVDNIPQGDKGDEGEPGADGGNCWDDPIGDADGNGIRDSADCIAALMSDPAFEAAVLTYVETQWDLDARTTALEAARTNWDLAYGWGNHAGLYLPASHDASAVTAAGIANWNAASGWGNHALGGYAAEADLSTLEQDVDWARTSNPWVDFVNQYPGTTDYGHLTLTGLNLQLVSGSGMTDAINGYGNLLVGYNEANQFTASIYPDDDPGAWEHFADPLEIPSATFMDDQRRGGSHNVIIGIGHQYMDHSGLAVGEDHRLGAPGAAVLGGRNNVVAGTGGAVVGSIGGQVRAEAGAVVGSFKSVAGALATPGDRTAVVLGGTNAMAEDSYSTTVGGSRTHATVGAISIGGDNQLCSAGYQVCTP